MVCVVRIKGYGAAPHPRNALLEARSLPPAEDKGSYWYTVRTAARDSGMVQLQLPRPATRDPRARRARDRRARRPRGRVTPHGSARPRDQRGRRQPRAQAQRARQLFQISNFVCAWPLTRCAHHSSCASLENSAPSWLQVPRHLPSRNLNVERYLCRLCDVDIDTCRRRRPTSM